MMDASHDSSTIVSARASSISNTNNISSTGVGSEHVQVVVRVRPLNKNELARGDSCCLTIDTGDSIEGNSSSSSSSSQHQQQVRIVIQKSATETQQFLVSTCLPAQTDQHTFFTQSGIISNLLDSALAGFRCCAFAFGQTGAGKTFTMVGGGSANKIHSGDPDDGVIGRSLEYLYRRFPVLEAVQSSATASVQFHVRISCIEIYHENVFDLFSHEHTHNSTATNNMSYTQSNKDRTPLGIREHASEGFYLEGLRIISCANCAEAIKVINSALRYRQLGSHDMNSRSSRSHCITDIYVDKVITPRTEASSNSNNSEGISRTRSYGDGMEPQTETPIIDSGRVQADNAHATAATVTTHMSATGTHGANVVKHCGKISMIDLAGSERLKNTASTGKVLQEAGFINKSLYVLGKVIAGLVRTGGDRNNMDVPYRDSKLTKILIESLGGNSKTMLIACVTESSASMLESMRTLKFSISCARIKNIPVVMKQDQAHLVSELRDQIYRLKQENKKLRLSLEYKVATAQSNLVPHKQQHAYLRQQQQQQQRQHQHQNPNQQHNALFPRMRRMMNPNSEDDNNNSKRSKQPRAKYVNNKRVLVTNKSRPKQDHHAASHNVQTHQDTSVDAPAKTDTEMLIDSLLGSDDELEQLSVHGSVTGQQRPPRAKPARLATNSNTNSNTNSSSNNAVVGSGFSVGRRRLQVNDVLKDYSDSDNDSHYTTKAGKQGHKNVGNTSSEVSVHAVAEVINAKDFIADLPTHAADQSDQELAHNSSIDEEDPTSLRKEQQRLRILEKKVLGNNSKQTQSDTDISGGSKQSRKPPPRAQMTKLEMMQAKMQKLEDNSNNKLSEDEESISERKAAAKRKQQPANTQSSAAIWSTEDKPPQLAGAGKKVVKDNSNSNSKPGPTGKPSKKPSPYTAHLKDGPDKKSSSKTKPQRAQPQSQEPQSQSEFQSQQEPASLRFADNQDIYGESDADTNKNNNNIHLSKKLSSKKQSQHGHGQHVHMSAREDAVTVIQDAYDNEEFVAEEDANNEQTHSIKHAEPISEKTTSGRRKGTPILFKKYNPDDDEDEEEEGNRKDDEDDEDDELVDGLLQSNTHTGTQSKPSSVASSLINDWADMEAVELPPLTPTDTHNNTPATTATSGSTSSPTPSTYSQSNKQQSSTKSTIQFTTNTSTAASSQKDTSSDADIDLNQHAKLIASAEEHLQTVENTVLNSLMDQLDDMPGFMSAEDEEAWQVLQREKLALQQEIELSKMLSQDLADVNTQIQKQASEQTGEGGAVEEFEENYEEENYEDDNEFENEEEIAVVESQQKTSSSTVNTSTRKSSSKKRSNKQQTPTQPLSARTNDVIEDSVDDAAYEDSTAFQPTLDFCISGKSLMTKPSDNQSNKQSVDQSLQPSSKASVKEIVKQSVKQSVKLSSKETAAAEDNYEDDADYEDDTQSSPVVEAKEASIKARGMDSLSRKQASFEQASSEQEPVEAADKASSVKQQQQQEPALVQDVEQEDDYDDVMFDDSQAESKAASTKPEEKQKQESVKLADVSSMPVPSDKESNKDIIADVPTDIPVAASVKQEPSAIATTATTVANITNVADISTRPPLAVPSDSAKYLRMEEEHVTARDYTEDDDKRLSRKSCMDESPTHPNSQHNSNSSHKNDDSHRTAFKDFDDDPNGNHTVDSNMNSIEEGNEQTLEHMSSKHSIVGPLVKVHSDLSNVDTQEYEDEFDATTNTDLWSGGAHNQITPRTSSQSHPQSVYRDPSSSPYMSSPTTHASPVILNLNPIRFQQQQQQQIQQQMQSQKLQQLEDINNSLHANADESGVNTGGAGLSIQVSDVSAVSTARSSTLPSSQVSAVSSPTHGNEDYSIHRILLSSTKDDDLQLFAAAEAPEPSIDEQAVDDGAEDNRNESTFHSTLSNNQREDELETQQSLKQSQQVEITNALSYDNYFDPEGQSPGDQSAAASNYPSSKGDEDGPSADVGGSGKGTNDDNHKDVVNLEGSTSHRSPQRVVIDNSRVIDALADSSKAQATLPASTKNVTGFETSFPASKDASGSEMTSSKEETLTSDSNDGKPVSDEDIARNVNAMVDLMFLAMGDDDDIDYTA
jgi:hypothetical protein